MGWRVPYTEASHHLTAPSSPPVLGPCRLGAPEIALSRLPFCLSGSPSALEVPGECEVLFPVTAPASSFMPSHLLRTEGSSTKASSGRLPNWGAAQWLPVTQPPLHPACLDLLRSAHWPPLCSLSEVPPWSGSLLPNFRVVCFVSFTFESVSLPLNEGPFLTSRYLQMTPQSPDHRQAHGNLHKHVLSIRMNEVSSSAWRRKKTNGVASPTLSMKQWCNLVSGRQLAH